MSSRSVALRRGLPDPQAGGLFVITSPLNFRIHGYPDDYWRMTPNCLRRMLEPYAARLTGYQGYHKFPAHRHGRGREGAGPVRRRCAIEASRSVITTG